MKLKNPDSKKGMVFGGCSFTWGQGLYYYSNLSTLREPAPDSFDPTLVTFAQKKFMESRRFARIVSKNFKSFDFVYHGNGGSNEGVVRWWESCIFREKRMGRYLDGQEILDIFPSEISHFVFQLTMWNRDHILLRDLYGTYDIQFSDALSPRYKDLFLKKLERDKVDLDSFTENHIYESFNRVRNFLKELENVGIKTLILSWPDEYVNYINSDPWSKERFVPIYYKGVFYSSINELMNSRKDDGSLMNPEMTIKYDVENFLDPPKDHHPSLKCHQTIAENLIKKIENSL